MRKLIINGHVIYYEKNTGFLFTGRHRTGRISKGFYSDKQVRDAIALADQTDGRKANGGAGRGGGRKPRTTEGQRNRNVYLTDSEHSYLVWKHGSFTEAVRSLLTMGWEKTMEETDIIAQLNSTIIQKKKRQSAKKNKEEITKQ